MIFLTTGIHRVIDILACIHGYQDISGAASLRKNSSSHWTTALLLGAITLILGEILAFNPFVAFTTVLRFMGAFLVYAGLSDLWISVQVGKAARQAGKDANTMWNAIDIESRDSEQTKRAA